MQTVYSPNMYIDWKNDQIPILQLGHDFYDPVKVATFPEKKMCYFNKQVGDTLKIENLVDKLWNFKSLINNISEPLALRYHGHQFQNYNPNLGDGRGFLYAQIRLDNYWHDLGTKGSGTTPYSRGGDGRLTLKGAVREALATEMLTSLNVKTSQTLCFYETGEKLERHDEPSPTRAAVLTRFSLGHIRIGTFQRLAYLKQIENIKKLTSYCLFFYYPDEFKKIDPTNENLLASRFLQNVVEANAKLAAQVMMAGFVHGVLNTDNINIAGELFDYGPYRFLPEYNPDFTAAYFDQNGLYSFGRQPISFLWALHQLADSLELAFPDLPKNEILECFSDLFNESIQFYFLKKLNLKSLSFEQNQKLLTTFFEFLEKNNLNFSETFFDFHSQKVLSSKTLLEKYKKYSFGLATVLQLLESFEIENIELSISNYFSSEKPTTLLIDEIESIWKPIADHDDWSLFNNKLQSIRLMK